MSEYVFKMPDLGEGTVDAEIVAWHVKPDDLVSEDQLMVEVMTDKAAVEVPAPVSGRLISVTGAPGDKVAVGSPLAVFDVGAAERAPSSPPARSPSPEAQAAPQRSPAEPTPPGPSPVHRQAAAPSRAPGTANGDGADAGGARPGEAAVGDADAALADTGNAAPERAGRVMTSPANRRRAREAGIDIASVPGSGPGGRILRNDLNQALARAPGRGDAKAAPAGGGAGGWTGAASATAAARGVGAGAAATRTAGEVTEIKVIGLRRVIAERMSEAKRNIPHFAYVEEVDVTELESLRIHLNAGGRGPQASLSYLPFVVAALVRVLEAFPQCNALYDAARGVLLRHRAVHVGIATQTPDGLKVPVVRNAEARSLWDLSSEIKRLAERARTNKAGREELSGSTITVTSLGRLGGIVSTPIINAPEVAIIGLNKAVERPVVAGGAIAVRRMMNLSSSFDHRFVDGHDAAAMIQALKELLEHPATIFIPKADIP